MNELRQIYLPQMFTVHEAGGWTMESREKEMGANLRGKMYIVLRSKMMRKTIV